MSRRQTMEEVSKHRYDEMELGKDPLTRELREKCRKVAILAFQDGAEVAEKTMIEKACEWLKSVVSEYIEINDWEEMVIDTENLLYDFKKAMEE